MMTTDGILANAYRRIIEKWMAILVCTVSRFNVFNLLSITLIALHHSQNITTTYSKVTVSSVVKKNYYFWTDFARTFLDKQSSSKQS